MDMTPLLDLLTKNRDVLKVFHAGGQDIEIVANLTATTPHPLFDTQVAAMALGQGEQIGYSNLVDSWLGIQIDKGARFTDWSRRPLDKRQIDYAIADVTHLAAIRSEEHTSELQSLMRISYAVFCLKKKNHTHTH